MVNQLYGILKTYSVKETDRNLLEIYYKFLLEIFLANGITSKKEKYTRRGTELRVNPSRSKAILKDTSLLARLVNDCAVK